MRRYWLAALMLACVAPALAGVPVTGRQQHMVFPRKAVQAIAAHAYHQKLAQLAARGMLDNDAQALRRIRQICSRLIAQAILLKPAAASWPWEVHVTSDPEIAAYSMAGGKLMVSTAFIKNYKLSDDELTVALAHEVGHVIAEHVREQISRAASFESAPPNHPLKITDVINDMKFDISIFLRLQSLSRLQEMEADDIGIELAARSGVPPSAVTTFYAKLDQSGNQQSIFDTHGSPLQRERFVDSMAQYSRKLYEASQTASLPSYQFR